VLDLNDYPPFGLQLREVETFVFEAFVLEYFEVSIVLARRRCEHSAQYLEVKGGRVRAAEEVEEVGGGVEGLVEVQLHF
jgi:hypothetical protein